MDGLTATESVRVRVFDVNRAPLLSLTRALDPALLPDAEGDALETLVLPPTVTVQMLSVATIEVTGLDADGDNLSVGVACLGGRVRVHGGPLASPLSRSRLSPLGMRTDSRCC